MSEKTDVTIKILTDEMAQEIKFLLYAVLWTFCTLNIWIYVKILKVTKEVFAKKRNNNSDHIFLNSTSIVDNEC